jgi:hypothetical protein
MRAPGARLWTSHEVAVRQLFLPAAPLKGFVDGRFDRVEHGGPVELCGEGGHVPERQAIHHLRISVLDVEARAEAAKALLANASAYVRHPPVPLVACLQQSRHRRYESLVMQ